MRTLLEIVWLPGLVVIGSIVWIALVVRSLFRGRSGKRGTALETTDDTSLMLLPFEADGMDGDDHLPH